MATPSLDAQFLGQTNRRLGLVSGIFAVAIAVLIGVSLLLYGPLGWDVPGHLPHFLGAQTTLFVISCAMALVCWREVLSPLATMRLGLGYQIAGAVIISVCAFHGDMHLQSTMVQLSWLAVWILLFPLLVPGPPLRSLVVSILCATSAPAVFLTWIVVHERALPEAPLLAATFLPYYVCAGLAVFPAWLVYDLGATASRARRVARQLGSYRLIELLGEGGMGEVWRAEHSLLARPAAVKLVRAHPNTPKGLERSEVLARFAREAKATASLTSPHTVSLYDYGVTADGTLYYAMELLQGIDLESLVQQFGPISPARAVALLQQVCDSLSEAHHAGLVHRDIKPANVMVCRVGAQVDFVKVLDFGLVRSLCPAERDRLVTDDDHLLGTPAFMAPEMARAPEEVDGRADIYALGCVAYWLVTGRLVFDQPTVVATVADHLRVAPTPPSEQAEQTIPESLERLILDCLAKDPADRPASAAEVSRRLGEVPVPRSWTQHQAQLWWHARLRRFVAPEAVGEEPQAQAPLGGVSTASEARIRARQALDS